jgi:hypothetical protein
MMAASRRAILAEHNNRGFDRKRSANIMAVRNPYNYIS